MYTIELKDINDEVITSWERDTQKDALAAARYMLTDDFAKTVESTHELMQTDRAEVYNEKREIIFDRFR
jgi:hypothetical protein